MKTFYYGACKLIRNNVLSINELNVSSYSNIGIGDIITELPTWYWKWWLLRFARMFVFLLTYLVTSLAATVPSLVDPVGEHSLACWFDH